MKAKCPVRHLRVASNSNEKQGEKKTHTRTKFLLSNYKWKFLTMHPPRKTIKWSYQKSKALSIRNTDITVQ